MCIRIKWLVLWSLWAARLVPSPTPTRRLPHGAKLRGRLAPDGSHEQYFGIPYASSQYKYRFQAPGPAPTWRGVLDAVNENIKCPQVYGEALMHGTEDCLTLNVYTPVAVHGRETALRPVMVFIHGGGFFEGSGSRLLYGPEYIVAQGVVLVTFNYRLNVLGFLCLGIKEAPGNAGLKDQVAALKWVQRNIEAFGGDPNDVTIFGESAGGASVSYHLLSPMSRGLFHKAIIQSGSSLAPWARQRDPLGSAMSLARVLGHNVIDPHQLYNIFMNTTLSDLIVTKIPMKMGELKFSNLKFTPCIEHQIDGVKPFLTDKPYNVLTKGEYNKVPVIIGSNDEEGYFLAAMDDEGSLKNINFEVILETFDLEFPSEIEKQEAAQQIKKIHVGDNEVSSDTILQFSGLHGVPYFNLPALMETELLLQTSDQPLYSYLFRYNGWRNFASLISGIKFWMAEGASHADDLFYLFSMFPVPSLFEDRMINIITTFWTNFAKYGTPTGPQSAVQWPAAAQGAPTTIVLNAHPTVTPFALNHTRHARALAYWRQLYEEYRGL